MVVLRLVAIFVPIVAGLQAEKVLLRVKLRRRRQLHFYTGSQNSLQRTDLSVFTGSKRVVFCTKVWLEKHFSPVKSYENAATSASQDETSPLFLSF